MAGPELGGVVGRPAGSVAGYDYSSALRTAHLNWTGDELDEWLAGPQKLVPGARMPVRVLDAPSRHDIIAYLATLGPKHDAVAPGNGPAAGY
ncbi:c-type cytochrome [Bradyrhizobium guangxiense]